MLSLVNGGNTHGELPDTVLISIGVKECLWVMYLQPAFKDCCKKAITRGSGSQVGCVGYEKVPWMTKICICVSCLIDLVNRLDVLAGNRNSGLGEPKNKFAMPTVRLLMYRIIL